ncbi:MAG: hypothetical protein ABSF32_09345 [Ignavibacteria bacterium]|jgi:photosystem II stability/assembly factor-like uncharacterized protein
MKKLNTLSPLQRSPSGQANPLQGGNTRDTLSLQANPLQAGSTLFFYIAILIFLIGFNFTDTPPPFGWYQQFMPNLNGMPVSDIFFLDSLTGWAVTGTNSGPGHINYILKTTNSGDNWNIVFSDTSFFSRVKFINFNTGYSSGGSGGGTGYLYKTTNGGINWVRYVYGIAELEDMSVLNKDTLWVVDHDPLTGGVFLTTNGGANWTQQAAFGINNPSHIYMFNARIGFIDGGGLKKTTDGGTTWVPISGGDYFTKMYLVDSLTGWKCNGYMKKTTNGGYNWTTQTLPQGGIIITSEMNKFSNIGRDTIWGVGGWVFYSANGNRGMIYRTTNGGNNWLFQVPDTSINISEYYHNSFIDKLHGWAYPYVNRGVHTITGGDAVWYTGIVQQSKDVPKSFILKQNYPNPFNPRTVIPYSLKSSGYVRIIAYDILGREVQRMVDQKQSAGEYEVDFMGKFTATGVYFYRMTVDPSTGSGQAFIDTKKMILLK